jgi:hypothetical protein
MTVNSLALVLLASGIIRLSPIFLAYLDDTPPGTLEASGQISPGRPAAAGAGETPGVTVSARTSGSERGLAARARTFSASSVLPEKQGGAEGPQFTADSEAQDPEKEVYRLHRTILIDQPAGVSAPPPVARSQVLNIPIGTIDLRNPPDAVPQARTGLTKTVSHRASEVYGSFGRPFARSGKSTAAFFVKAATSIGKSF